MGKIAITMGDPAGIGAEIILKALNELADTSELMIIGNREIFSRAEKISQVSLKSDIGFLDIPFDTDKIINGVENEYSGELSFQCLKKACELANSNVISGIATAPLSKNALNMAGHNFSGQTEILEYELGEKKTKGRNGFCSKKFKNSFVNTPSSSKNDFR